MDTNATLELRNAAFQLTVTLGPGRAVQVALRDAAAGTAWAEGAYVYRAARAVAEGGRARPPRKS